MEVSQYDKTQTDLGGAHHWASHAVPGALERLVGKGMKRTAVLLMLLCMLTVTASAAYVPEDVVSENRDGRQLIIKTYTLPPDADPSELIEEPFELEGYTYHHLETIKEEQAFKDSKAQTEVVTLETDTDDLAKILEQLAPTMEYNKDGFSGTLTLDHTTIQTEAAGYTTKYYTITDTKQFPGLSRNDPSCVPTTTVKNGSITVLDEIRPGFQSSLPKIPYTLMVQALSLFRAMMHRGKGRRPTEALVHVYWDKLQQQYFIYIPKQLVSHASVDAWLDNEALQDSDRYIHYADLHSHNQMPAVFSKTDDHDERPTRVYMVVGRLDRYFPEITVRISNGGHFWEIPPEEVLEPFPVGNFPPEWLEQIHTDPKEMFEVAA